MKVRRHIVLYLICLPWDLVAYFVVLFIRIFWGKDLKWETPPYSATSGGGPCLTCQIKEGSLPVRKGIFPVGWYLHDKKINPPRAWGGTTLGHGIFYGPGGRSSDPNNTWTETQEHEHYHVEQFEASMVQAFLGALIIGGVVWLLGHPIPALIGFSFIWFTGYLFMGIGGWLTASLRGEPAYLGSQHEESARAQTYQRRNKQ